MLGIKNTLTNENDSQKPTNLIWKIKNRQNVELACHCLLYLESKPNFYNKIGFYRF